MNLKLNVEKNAASRLKYPADAGSVAKDKRYKLGVWLHGEYRQKSKKPRNAISGV
jgi:hypothetical protein